MKNLLIIFTLVISFNFHSKAQEPPIAGELIIDFVDRPATWELTVSIYNNNTTWDCDFNLTTDYSGGFINYTQNSQYFSHYSDACWHYQGFDPELALGIYKISVGQPYPQDEKGVWFYIDWRTSDLPPGAGEWEDQHFVYNVQDNKIYKYLDPNQTSISGQTIKIWDAISEIGQDTTDLEPYAPTNLESTPWFNHPKLTWDHPELDDDYRTGYEVWRKFGTWEKLVTINNPSIHTWIDWTYDIGEREVQYKVRAINGNAVSAWSNTISIYPSFAKISEKNDDNLVKSLEYELYQNYPNPFNPKTTIKFSLKEDAFVVLKIFDILGNEINTLINNNLQAGHHEIQFDAREMDSGVYIYNLYANDFMDTKKLILIK